MTPSIAAVLLPLLLAAGPPPPADPARVAARLIAEETVSREAWKKLTRLTDRIGNRLSGSPQAAQAVAWALGELERDGVEKVRSERVVVPHWVRGEEEVELASPTTRRIAALALGGSVATPAAGIEARVIAVSSLEELEARGGEAAGAIVLFNKQIVANGGKDDGYGAGAGMRYNGPPRAAKLGAVGMLIRSLGTASLRTPHTGSTGYEDGVEPIPAAAIAIEDAELLVRLIAAGESPRACMRLTCRTLPDVVSANVIGEVRGRERPDEVVLIGAHLDSWDVGQGAIDDGAGVVVVMETLRLLLALDLRPARTVRGVLYMNEENGLRGGQFYERQHREELVKHVAAIESDAGAGRPKGFNLKAGPGAAAILERLLAPLIGYGAARSLTDEGTGADISTLESAGVPVLGLQQDMTRYFEWHHTEADTADKIDPEDLGRNVVSMAYAAWALAESAETLPRIPSPVIARSW